MRFDSEKITTTFIYPATPYEPVNNRKYTLTHSDNTGELFLDIGTKYNFSAINNEIRDEVLGKLVLASDNTFKIFFYLYVGDGDFETASNRYNIFKSHMNHALQSIIFGDIALFDEYPQLLNTPIYVKFDSLYPIFNNYEHYGYVSDYIS